MPNDLYRQVTDRIIEQLESGRTPFWRRPWDSPSGGMPRNAVSQRVYRGGFNVLLLWEMADRKGYSSNLWGTYRQWDMLGGQVRRGERATKITYFKPWTETSYDLDSGEEKEKDRFVLKEFNVFNLDQVDGEALQRFRPVTRPKREFVDYEPAEETIIATGADFHHGGSRAYYDAKSDIIVVPFKNQFISQEAYYTVLMHEAIHWTGHSTRLNRLETPNRFGSDSYAREELVAELGAAFLTSELQIPNVTESTQSASYLAGWLDVLRSDSTAIVKAASAASKASDYVLSFSREPEPVEK